MKKLLFLLVAFGIIGLCSFSSIPNMRAPDCDACYKQDGWSDPAEPWGYEVCYSLAEGPCGESNLCGPGTGYCLWYTCYTWIDGCWEEPPPSE